MLSLLRPELDAFRREVRAFIAEHYPADMRVTDPYEELDRDQQRLWHRILYEKGWSAASWPKEHGGTGWSPLQRHIWQQELAAADALPLLAFSVTMVGPVIYTYGSAEQKARFLPGILSGSDWWCQGYSEPGAGSDLAKVRTRAERRGDHYIVNGHKTWTTFAQHADWIFALVRTDPEARPQAGISFLLIPMTADGVTVRPIGMIDGTEEVNDVFFDDVKVPLENLIGEENRGWSYAKFLLGNERTGMASTPRSRRALETLRGLADPRDRRLADAISEAEIDLMALEAVELAALLAQESGDSGEPGLASIFKIRGTEIYQRITALGVEAIGMAGLVNRATRGTESEFLPPHGRMATQEYLNARKKSIYGGSNEIQRNIIAAQVLGL